MEDEVAKWREALLESAVEQDDDAMEAYLEVAACQLLNSLALGAVDLWKAHFS